MSAFVLMALNVYMTKGEWDATLFVDNALFML